MLILDNLALHLQGLGSHQVLGCIRCERRSNRRSAVGQDLRAGHGAGWRV